MKLFLLLSFVLVSNSVFSGAWVGADVVSLKSLSDQKNHYIYVDKFSNPNNCSASNILAIVRDDASNWQMVHSNILAGFLSNKKMRFRVVGCSGSYTVVDGVEILK